MKHDGGPAFPETATTYNTHREEYEIGSYGGMSLRDWFAGMALKEAMVLVREVGNRPDMEATTRAAAIAYKHADAMLAEREKK